MTLPQLIHWTAVLRHNIFSHFVVALPRKSDFTLEMLCMHHIIPNRYIHPGSGFCSWLFDPDHGGNRTTKLCLDAYLIPLSLTVWNHQNPVPWTWLIPRESEATALCSTDAVAVQYWTDKSDAILMQYWCSFGWAWAVHWYDDINIAHIFIFYFSFSRKKNCEFAELRLNGLFRNVEVVSNLQ